MNFAQAILWSGLVDGKQLEYEKFSSKANLYNFSGLTF